MVLCQIYTTDATAQTYAINLFGRKKVKIVKVDYVFTAGGSDKIIALKSNFLRLAFGNYSNFCFASNSVHQIGNIHSDLELDTKDFNGNFDLEVLDVATNVQPIGFLKLVLSLDITDSE